MIRKIICFFWIAGISFFLSNLAWAGDQQNYSNQGAWWVNLGAGVGYFNFDDKPNYPGLYDNGPAYGVSFNYMTANNQLLTIRSTGISGINSGLAESIVCSLISPVTTNCDAHDATVIDVAVLYGVIHKGRYGYVSASAGLGLVRANPPTITVDNSTVSDPARYTVGLPLEIQAFWTPSPYFGIGLIGFGNVNSHYSNVGGLLAIQIGNLVI